MMIIEDDGPVSCPEIRNAVFGLLLENDVPYPLATKALCQCLEVLRDVDRTHSVASDLGLEVSGLRSDDTLALYWNVSRDGRCVGFIYRGWDDPGFGIGECVPVLAAEMPVFMAQADVAVKFLATNGLSLTTEPMPDGGYWLNMTTVIYSDGFNAGTLAGALDAIWAGVRTVREMVA